MDIKLLSKDYQDDLRNLVKTTIQNLQNPEWLIALTDIEIDNIFDNNQVILYGAIENDVLLSISGLFFDKSDFLDIVKLLGIENKKVAEIAECMTFPEYRGNNYMLKINQVLLKKAKELGIEYLIATAHPDNIASNTSLSKLGMKCSGQIQRYGKFLRNYYVIKI